MRGSDIGSGRIRSTAHATLNAARRLFSEIRVDRVRNARCVVLIIMASITMWKRGDRVCQLLVGAAREGRYTLQIRNQADVLRHERMRSADEAMLVSEIWHVEEAESIFGAVPPV